MLRKSLLPISFFIAILSGCACTQQGDSTHGPVVADPHDQPETPVDTTPPETNPPKPDETPQPLPFEDTPLPNTLRIATWNVHNYFDTVCDSASGCGGSNYEPYVSETSYRTKMLSVADGIKKIDADVLLLQEIEKDSCLVDVQNWLGTNIYPSYAFGEMGNTAGLDVAILTRGTITNVITYRDKYWISQPDGSQKRLARELLAAEITLPNGIELTAFTTHFVSKATDAEGSRRLGEAKLTRELLDTYIAEHPGRLVVFGGDLNDFPDSEQIQTLSGDENLNSVADKIEGPITTWGDSATFDYLFYSAEDVQKLHNAEVICDGYRQNGFSSSDHCSVKAVFEF
ncbi:MAG: endonuclease/exonuclease/phosphatase family protein [Proteobacteria bacterium]|nr:endonuclease/exonuclease/phosphatase family protein [Pseudomonadota bacterium]